MNLEAALFDAIPLTSGRQNGADYRELNVPPQFKLDDNNMTSVVEKVINTLLNYETLLPEFHLVKQWYK